MKKILRNSEAADFLGVSPRTMEKLRLTGGGPTFIKMGRRAVGYLEADLEAWIADRRRTSTSDPGGQYVSDPGGGR